MVIIVPIAFVAWIYALIRYPAIRRFTAAAMLAGILLLVLLLVVLAVAS